MQGVINKLFVFKSLLTTPSNVSHLHLKQIFPPIIWIFTEGKCDIIESRLPFKIFSTLVKLFFPKRMPNFGEIVAWKQVYFLSCRFECASWITKPQIFSWLYCLSSIERGHLNRTLGKTDLNWKVIAYNFIRIHVNTENFWDDFDCLESWFYTKMNSLYQIRSKMLHSMKVIIWWKKKRKDVAWLGFELTTSMLKVESGDHYTMDSSWWICIFLVS